MKKLFSVCFVVFICLLMINSQIVRAQGTQPILDIAPNHNTAPADTTPSANFPFPTIFNWHYSQVPNVNGGTVGAMHFNNNFYFNRWNSADLYLYDGALNGPQNLVNTLTYFGQIRDLASDGNFLYGGRATGVIYQMDANGALVSQFNISGGIARALTYTPDEDGFFCSDFGTDIRLYSRTGTLIRTLTGTGAALPAKYGMAYSNFPGSGSLNGPTVWVWGQGSNADPYNKLWAINAQNGTVKESYQFGPLPPGTTSPLGIAGGANIQEINGVWVLLLNYQNYALAAYDLTSIVPVELTSFTADTRNNDVVLNWTTASEMNNQGFEVEKSINGVFQKIGYVAGHGTTTETQNYSYVDKNVGNGTHTYRLKQIDFDGTFTYSQEVFVDIAVPARFTLEQNYPNPFNPATKIEFGLAVDSKVNVKVFDILGQQIATLVEASMSAGFHSVDFDASGINSGVYFYTIEAVGNDGQKFSQTKKMMFMK